MTSQAASRRTHLDAFSSWLRACGLCLLVIATTLLTAVTAHADGPSEIDKDAARTSLEQGDERMAAKDYEGALEAYQRADEIMGVPTTSIEVGRSAMALGRLVIAYEAFKRAADFPRKKGEPPPFAKARKESRQLAKKVKPRIPRLTIEVDGAGPDVDVEVLIDEEPIDAWGRALGVDPGMHEIRARAVGYEPASQEVVLQEGEKRTVNLTLVAIVGPDRIIDSEPDDLWWTVAVVSLPIGGASLIAGAVTGALSLSDASAAKDQCDGNRCPPEAQSKIDSSQTLAHVSTATLVVGGVGVALGAVAIIIAISNGASDDSTEDGADDAEGLEAKLRVSPTGVALVVSF